MSLYNALHGMNPLAALLLRLLDLTPDKIPRYRDCYITEEGNIAVHTRTGGGNRDYYESAVRCQTYHPDSFASKEDAPAGPWNEDLRKIPGFLYDRDDDFDSTYATFYYKPTDPIAADLLVKLQAEIGTETPAEKWQKLFADMEANRDTPRVINALEVGAPIIDAIVAAIKDEN